MAGEGLSSSNLKSEPLGPEHTVQVQIVRAWPYKLSQTPDHLPGVPQDSQEFVLIAAEERGAEAGEAYGLGQEYSLLEPEPASAAAQAISKGLVAALRPAAEATKDHWSELLGLQAEVGLLTSLPDIALQ